ncbi:MAG: hypothetical protein ACRDZN_12035 [Acidimicrobiales bacterium]
MLDYASVFDLASLAQCMTKHGGAGAQPAGRHSDPEKEHGRSRTDRQRRPVPSGGGDVADQGFALLL